MARHRCNGRTPRRKIAGAHRKTRQRRSALASTVAAGAAAVCVGAATYSGAPTADALSILLPGPPVNGAGSTTRVNILEGNVFNPQFGVAGNSSRNLIIGHVAISQCNNFINQLLSIEINLSGTTGKDPTTTRINILSYNVFNPQIGLTGANISNNVTVTNVAMNNGNNSVTTVTGASGLLGAGAGNGNTVQFSFLSGNIFNPQMSLTGANISNNVTVTNVAMNNGNNSVATMTGAGGLLPFLGGGAGNGNTVQFASLSGNIFNPQISLTGANISNNAAVTNVAIGNGNFSQAITSMRNALGSFVFGGGNGVSSQYGFFVSNISNPQWTLGGGNTSNNSASTNTADGNGNNSTNEVTGGGLGSTVTGTGNGNTNQVAYGAGNIHNDQVNIGPGSASTADSNATTPAEDVIDVVAASSGVDTDAVGSFSARTAVSELASAALGRPSPTNRQSRQERRESFSLNRTGNRIAQRGPARNGANDAHNGSQTTNGDTADGDAAGGGDGTDGGGTSDNGGDGNSDSAD